jgi:hypothetical protein
MNFWKATIPSNAAAYEVFKANLYQKENRYLAQILIPSPKISKKSWRLVV